MMKNFKILMLFIFIIFLSNFVLGGEESKIINLNLENDSNLTIKIDGNSWWFNISSGILSVDINYTFFVPQEYVSNCTKWFNFNFDECFGVNDDLRSINKRLEVQLAGCEEPVSGTPGNRQCWSKRVLLDNKTTELTSCNTNLVNKENERGNTATQLITCNNDKLNMYNKNNINLLFALIAGIIIFIFYQKKGKTTDQKQVERKKGGPDMDGVDKKQLAEDMEQGGVV